MKKEENNNSFYTFTLDLVDDGTVIIKKDDSDLESFSLMGDIASFIFKFKSWVERYLDERELYNVEYATYIRLH